MLLWLKRGFLAALVLLILLEAAGFLMARAYSSLPLNPLPPPGKKGGGGDWKAKNRSLRARLEALAPRGAYVEVDTAANRLTIRNGDRILREAVVSCGSGGVLKDPSGDRKWVFDTPRGEYRIESKIRNPSWVRPDWAFIEEGENIPKDWRERIEEGVMGDYALGIGRGYFLHGTLYTRLLGRNVTHGCIRLGDADLAALFNTASMGTKVYIY